MLPNSEIACSVFMMPLKHTLQSEVKYTLKSVKYDCLMTTLEERVLEAIEATNLNVADLAKRLGVTRQAIYDWKKGKSLANMKAENLVEIAGLSGYEPAWIAKARGPKKKSLTLAQERVLKAMQESPEQQQLIADLVESIMKHKSQADPAPDPKKANEEKRLGDERRQRELGHKPERRQIPWAYKKGGI